MLLSSELAAVEAESQASQSSTDVLAILLGVLGSLFVLSIVIIVAICIIRRVKPHTFYKKRNMRSGISKPSNELSSTVNSISMWQVMQSTPTQRMVGLYNLVPSTRASMTIQLCLPLTPNLRYQHYIILIIRFTWIFTHNYLSSLVSRALANIGQEHEFKSHSESSFMCIVPFPYIVCVD